MNLLLSRSARLQENVNALYIRLLFTDDVVAALEADGALAPGVRHKAVRIAQARDDKPFRLNADSWNLVRSPGSDAEAYQIGLCGAEAAVGADLENIVFLSTLGVAQYRNGQYAEAHATLTQCDQLRREQGGVGVRRVVAFLTMTLAKLGRAEEAQTIFERLKALIYDQRDELWWFRESTTAWLKECEQLVELSDSQAEPPENHEKGVN